MLVEEGTVSDTETVAEPDPLSPETVTVVLYVPAFSDPRSALREIVRVSFPQTVPEVAFSESQLAFSLADHEKALLVVFVSVSDAVLPVLPKSTWTGDTNIFTGLPASEETSTGEEELQACVTARKNREDAIIGTRMSVGCTASLRESRFAGRRRSGGQRLPDELIACECRNERAVFRNGAAWAKIHEKRNPSSSLVAGYYRRSGYPHQTGWAKRHGQGSPEQIAWKRVY